METILTQPRPRLFGILNVTPDSFSDGGKYMNLDRAVAAGLRMAEEGADAIDVGGESTRPGSQPVPPDEQIRRTQPAIAALAARLGPDGPAISIDTRSAKVAAAAIKAGATIINDISALRDDPDMAGLAAEHGCEVILMHMQGTPATMQDAPHYDDVVGEVRAFLAERIEVAVAAGIPRERIIIDPGIGFGKTGPHNLTLLRRIAEFRTLGVSVMVGPSRKRFIAEIFNGIPADQRDLGTAGVVAACVLAGVECLRVHNVGVCRQVADVCRVLRTP